MSLEELKKLCYEMLKNLVNCLGLDGEFYISTNRNIIAFADINVPGEFLTAKSKDLKDFLENQNIDIKKKKYIFSEGLILINKEYKNKPADADLMVTLIHETLHSNRMLLVNSQIQTNKNISSVFFDNKRFVQNTSSDKAYYADPAQEILMAPIDDSKKTIQKYSALSNPVKINMTFDDIVYNDKMTQQVKIDEALVETMAMVAYLLYKKQTDNIMETIKYINEFHDADDIKAITSIILRHNNLELFKWMIDPLSYQLDFINYDYFSNYINEEDQEDFETLKKSNEITELDDEELDDEELDDEKLKK